MYSLAIRTEKPEAELYLLKGGEVIESEKWQAHRELSTTIHQKIVDILKKHNLNPGQLNAIICFNDGGSFTGLRIGITVANALAYSYDIPVVTASGENWQKVKTDQEKRFIPITPNYGAPVHITLQKK